MKTHGSAAPGGMRDGCSVPRSRGCAPAAQESLALRNGLLEKLVGMRAAQAASSGASVVQAAPAAWCAAQPPL
jgi:hypothetical protein